MLSAAFRAHATIQAYEAARALASEYDRAQRGSGSAKKAQDLICKGTRELIEQGMKVTPDAYDDARRTASQARKARRRPHGRLRRDPVAVGAGRAAEGISPSTGSSTFNRLWTLMGTPCVNVPGLTDPNGLPLGVQVIGRFGADRATLEAALFVESALARRG